MCPIKVHSESDFLLYVAIYVSQCKTAWFPTKWFTQNIWIRLLCLQFGRTGQGCNFWNTLIKSANLLTNQKHVLKYNSDYQLLGANKMWGICYVGLTKAINVQTWITFFPQLKFLVDLHSQNVQRLNLTIYLTINIWNSKEQPEEQP